MTNAEDFFKALVCGHSHYDRRGWIMLKGYFDDSRKGSGEVLVLGGYIAEADNWLAYNKSCQEMLDRLPVEEFKMVEAVVSPELMEHQFWLYKQAIEPNVRARVAIIVSTSDLVEVIDSFPWPAEIFNYEMFKDPYFIAWKGIVSTITHGRIDAGNPNPIEIVFDRQNTQEDEILRGWLDFKKDATPEQIEQVGGMPLFGDSKKILPLQAADQYAWWIRKWYLESENQNEFIKKLDNPPYTWSDIEVDYKKIPQETILLSKPVIRGVLKAMFDIHEVQKVSLGAVI